MKLSEGITLSQMANKLNISYAQIRNLKDLKVEKPTFTTTIKFFIMLRTERDKRSQLMKEDYPEMYRHEQEQEERAPAGTIDPEYSNKTSDSVMSYQIFSIADCYCGLQKSIVTELWGAGGNSVLEDLINEEILTERDGLVKSTAEITRNTDRNINIKKQKMCLEIIDPNDIGELGSWLSTLTQSVNQSTYKEVKTKIQDLFYEIYSVVQNPCNTGNIPLFFNMNLGKFLRDKK
jgi:hypothetical protein